MSSFFSRGKCWKCKLSNLLRGSESRIARPRSGNLSVSYLSTASVGGGAGDRGGRDGAAAQKPLPRKNPGGPKGRRDPGGKEGTGKEGTGREGGREGGSRIHKLSYDLGQKKFAPKFF